MEDAVLRYLANSAGPSGTLLVLDDLQWAGPDALDLLVLLVREADPPLRMVGAYRDTEVGPHNPLGITLADLAQRGLARRHVLTPLAEEEAGQLLVTLLQGMEGNHTALLTQIARRTGGVPFFLGELCAGTTTRMRPSQGRR